jgi:hypothetical protein
MLRLLQWSHSRVVAFNYYETMQFFIIILTMFLLFNNFYYEVTNKCEIRKINEYTWFSYHYWKHCIYHFKVMFWFIPSVNKRKRASSAVYLFILFLKKFYRKELCLKIMIRSDISLFVFIRNFFIMHVYAFNHIV